MGPQRSQVQVIGSNVRAEVLDWLADSPVFSGLGRGALCKVAEGSRLRRFEAFEEAVVEGELPTDLNIVVSGRFIILLPTERITRLVENAMVDLDCYIAGDSFGEAALVDDHHVPAPASVVSTERSEVLSISPDQMARSIGSDSRIGQVVYRNLFSIQTRRLQRLVD